MPIPDIFYCSQKNSGLVYSKNPPGRLDVEQFVKGKPCWVRGSQISELQPKSLILADWSAMAWSSSFRMQVRDRLAEMMDEGFNFYLWQDGNVVPLSRELLFSVDYDADKHKITSAFAHEMTVANPNFIIDSVVRQHHIARDKIHVLDDYWLRVLVDPKQLDKPRAFDIAKFLDVALALQLENSSDYLQMVLSALSHSSPAVEEIIFNSNFFPHNNLVGEVQKFFPRSVLFNEHLTLLLNDYRTLFMMNPDHFEDIFTEKGLIFNGEKLTPNDLEQIEYIYFCKGQFNLKQINLLAGVLPNLKCLNLAFEEVQHTDFDNTIIADVEVLNLSGALNERYLSSLFAHTKQLKELTIECDDRIEMDEFKSFDLQRLEAFCLKFKEGVSGELSRQQLASFLKQSNNLRVLVLKDCGIELLPDLDLPVLQELDLRNNSLELESLLNFIQKLPKLKSLNLANSLSMQYKQTTPIIFFHETMPQLDELETLNMNDTNVDSSFLGYFLRKAPSLKFLSVEGCSELFKQLTAPSYLMNIETLHAGRCTSLKFSVLQSMIGGNNRVLKHLDLSGSELIFDFPKFSIPRLDSLNISNTKISNEQLKFLLAALPDLQTIDLSGCVALQLEDDPELMARLEGINTRWPRSKNGTSVICTELEMTELQTVSEDDGGEIAHNPQLTEQFKPTPIDQRFVYKGENKTFDQGMIIEQMSRYFSLKGEHLAYIPRIQDGICRGLAYYFNKHSLEAWNKLIQTIVRWDGTLEGLNPELEVIFCDMFEEIRTSYFSEQQPSIHFLGENLNKFISQNKSVIAKEGCILVNPWHAIATKYLSETKQWCIYDPNAVSGYQVIPEEQLMPTLLQILGPLISVQNWKKNKPSPKLKNINAFVQQGGLLMFLGLDNKKQLLSSLAAITKSGKIKWTEEAFDGLFVRDTSGQPAWVDALYDEDGKNYVASLLQQYFKHNPEACFRRLKESLDVLEPLDKQECMTLLLQTPGIDFQLYCTVGKAVHTSSNKSHYLSQLATWHKDKSLTTTALEYCQQVIAEGEKNRKQLIELDSLPSLRAMQLALQSYCQSTSRSVFYVDEPDDLICIKRRSGPGSLLFNFLKAVEGQVNPPPVLIINYARFSADDIVRFNSLFDETRSVDGVLLPEELRVVGLQDTSNPLCYRGEDFYSRLDRVDHCSLSEHVLEAAIKTMPLRELNSDERSDEMLVINLCHAFDWRERLLGHWVLKDNCLLFEEGELIKALKARKNHQDILIENGLWQDENFVHFWQQAFVLGTLEVADQRLVIPDDLNLARKEGYQWQDLASSLSIYSQMKVGAEVINPTTLSKCFNQYHCDNENESLNSLPGLVEQNKNSTLDINLTRALFEDEWASLLLACRQHHVSLNCHLAPGIEVPPFLSDKVSTAQADLNTLEDSIATSIIVSTDIDVTLAEQCREQSVDKVIDVSEFQGSELLGKISAALGHQAGSFSFKEEAPFLIDRLEAGEHIILKGYFSNELLDVLAPLLLERFFLSDKKCKGQLQLITENQMIDFCPSRSHVVSVEEKIQYLKDQGYSKDDFVPLDDGMINALPSCKLLARLGYLKRHPDANSHDAWLGLDIELKPFTEIATVDLSKSVEISQAFIARRLDEVNRGFAISPYVVLSGLSGVGKSTFVEKQLAAQGNTRLYQGFNALSEYALEDSDDRKILFIDEANLEHRQWSEFEGLFHQPPAIFVDGTYYPLTPNHKVVFACNPLSYDDERKLPSFFERHGNAIVFEPMPAEFIFEEVIKPVFQGTKLESVADEVAIPLLMVYRALCLYSDREVLITPREVQMMALLLAANSVRLSKENTTELACHYAYQLARPFVPEKHLLDFESRFSPKVQSHYTPRAPRQFIVDDFTITESRQPIYQQLNELLSLREFRKQKANNQAQSYGGLGGMIIEGEPGIGKSELVVQALLVAGYRQAKLNATKVGDKAFYRLPVSLPFDEKRAVLIKAFNEGAVVIIDEINSSPMMEHLLNGLLMGKSPEGRRPLKTGFMIIATQNPISMAGRRAASQALSHRLMFSKLEHYSDRECYEILRKKGLKDHIIKELVDAYNEQRKQAETQCLSPAPTFRDLLKLAQQVAQPQQEITFFSNSSETKREEGRMSGLIAGSKKQIMRHGYENPDMQIIISSLTDYLQQKKPHFGLHFFVQNSMHKSIKKIIKDVELNKYESVERVVGKLQKIKCRKDGSFNKCLDGILSQIGSDASQKHFPN